MQINTRNYLLAISFCISGFALTSCNSNGKLQSGDWRAVIIPDTTRPDLELPFNIEFSYGNSSSILAKIRNADEIIEVTEIVETDDSLILHLPVFEGTIKAEKKKTKLIGIYTHKAAGRTWSVPFEAFRGENDRFTIPDEPALFDVSGKWKVEINPESPGAEIQVGEFRAEGNHLTGTFLTTIGDYRYLEGKVSGDQFMMSCFDGAHSLIFTARLSENGEIEEGIFCGGPYWKGTWRAVKDPDVSLPDATQLTYLKSGYESIDFSFPDLLGQMVSPEDEKYNNKALIIQIIGSWCPNCMDETRYFAELYRKYKTKGLEIIALCYESDDFEASKRAIFRFKNDLNAAYTFLHAGESNKNKASQTLPMINRVISYPTSIFINKEGEIQKIFTGFTGPGTGKHFDNLASEMTSLIESML